MASLNLLSIPREVRNLIYSYLTQELRLNWTEVFRTTHTDIATSVEVVVTNVPILSVHLAHSRLKDEYEQCPAFRKVTMTLRLKSRQDLNKQSLSVLSKRLKTYPASSIKHFLAHIVRVVILVDCGKRHQILFHGMVYQTSSNVWRTLQALTAPLAVLSPKLPSVKVAFSFKPGDALLHADEEHPNVTT
ncbi:hypothetical protein BKA63DRAFT_183822 [Paraphoma chrysanthemicola]|nr:hypothetical protein BKA63DRAFT_183822 [Paraphoma chrysanthemicola]